MIINRKIFLLMFFLCCWYTAFSTLLHAEREKIFPEDTASEMAKARAFYKKGLSSFNNQLNPKQTIAFLTSAKKVFKKHNVNQTSLVDIYFTLGLTYYLDLGDYPSAIHELRQANALKRGISKNFDTEYVRINRILGDIFWKRYEYDSAEYYYLQVFDNLSKVEGLPLEEYHGIYNSLGVLYYSYEDYALAVEYFQQSLHYGLKYFSADANEIVNARNNLATSFRRLGMFKEAKQLYQTLLPYNKSVSSIFQNLAKVYQDVLQYDSSLIYLKKAELTVAADDQLRIKIFNNFALTYTGLKNYDAALRYIDKAISLNQKVYKSKNVALAFSYMNRGKIYEERDKLKEALEEYQKGLTILHFNYRDQNIYSLPEDLNNLVSAPFFFECLWYKARVFDSYYQRTRNIQNLQTSLRTYELAIRLIDNIRKSYSSQEAKLFFSEKVHSIYADAVEVAYKMYVLTKHHQYKELAFSFSEKAKLAVLSDALMDLKLKAMPGIAEHLVKTERSLKAQISALFRKLADATDSLKIATLKNELSVAEIELAAVIRKFDSDKNYARLKYSDSLKSLTNLQKRFNKDEVLIEYFMGKNHVYIFTVSATNSSFLAQPVSSTFFKALQEWKSSLYDTPPGSIYYGESASHTLYDYLLKPVKGVLQPETRLIIIPDGELNYVPFEALSNDNRFLIYDHAVSYGYSSAFLDFVNHEGKSYSTTILSMAPFTDQRMTNGQFTSLVASRQEIESIRGEKYFGAEATKKVFMNKANAFDIVHLATHAKTFNDDPLKSHIAFFTNEKGKDSECKLYMPEIYNMNFDQVKLVVISACEVGGGKIMKGEGIISLSRAFAFGGCPNIVTSLWAAHDVTSATLMSSFHSYLEDGYDKDEALRNAKLDYLNSNIDQRLKSPVYWSNFIFIGNADPLYPKPVWWYLLGGTFLAFMSTILVMNRASLKNAVKNNKHSGMP
jgi:CHAT domain-containing protein/Tfp pilus assembly protein PilF